MSLSPAPRNETFLDTHDPASRAALAIRLGVSEGRLRKAVRMVGARISSITAYLNK